MSARSFAAALATLHKMFGMVERSATSAARAIDRASSSIGPSKSSPTNPYEPGSEKWFAWMRANETGGTGVPLDANGRPIEPSAAKPDPLRALRSGVATIATINAAGESVDRAAKALDDKVESFVRYGLEMDERTAEYLDDLRTKITVFGARGDAFMDKFFELVARVDEAQEDNNVFLAAEMRGFLDALVKDIRTWLGRDAVSFDPTKFFSMYRKSRTKRRSRLSYTSSRGATSTTSSNASTGGLP